MKKQSDTLIFQSVLLFTISLLAIIAAYFFRAEVSHLRTFGLIGILLINFFGNISLFLPGPAIASVVAGGSLYPPFAVAIMAAIGSSLGDMTSYVVGFSGKELTTRKKGKHYAYITGLFARFGEVFIFLCAFIPNPLFDGVGIIAGALSYPPKRFFLIMLVARFLRNLLLAYAGAHFLE